MSKVNVMSRVNIMSNVNDRLRKPGPVLRPLDRDLTRHLNTLRYGGEVMRVELIHVFQYAVINNTITITHCTNQD